MADKKDGRAKNGGKRPGAGPKIRGSEKVENAVTIKLTKSEAACLALVAERENLTNRQILMAGVKGLMKAGISDILPPEILNQL